MFRLRSMRAMNSFDSMTPIYLPARARKITLLMLFYIRFQVEAFTGWTAA
jgi:hypothetical protein